MLICSGYELLPKALQLLHKIYRRDLAAAASASVAIDYCNGFMPPIATVQHRCVKHSNCHYFAAAITFVMDCFIYCHSLFRNSYFI